MNRVKLLIGLVTAVFLLSGLLSAEADVGSDTMSQAAYATGNADTAVRYLLSKQVPVPEVIEKGMDSGVSQKQLVAALLSAGLEEKEVALEMMLGDAYLARKTLSALASNGIAADEVLTWLVKADANIELIVDTAAFMLSRGDTQSDVMQTLFGADAGHDVAVQVVRRLKISPAAVAGTRQVAGGNDEDDLSTDQTIGYSQWLASVLPGAGTWNNRPNTISPTKP